MITAQHLREILHYEPTTGFFTWLKCGTRTDLVGKRAGTLDAYGYVNICVGQKQYKGHRLAWLYMTGVWPDHEIDHENLIHDDNRFDNLREASTFQNNQNVSLKKSNNSGFKGVYFDGHAKRWRATIRHNGTRTYIGVFTTPEAAGKAYAAAAKKLHGEFARSN